MVVVDGSRRAWVCRGAFDGADVGFKMFLSDLISYSAMRSPGAGVPTSLNANFQRSGFGLRALLCGVEPRLGRLLHYGIQQFDVVPFAECARWLTAAGGCSPAAAPRPPPHTILPPPSSSQCICSFVLPPACQSHSCQAGPLRAEEEHCRRSMLSLRQANAVFTMCIC